MALNPKPLSHMELGALPDNAGFPQEHEHLKIHFFKLNLGFRV